MKHSVLLLNRNYTPILVISLQKAVILLFNKKAKILEVNSYSTYEWEEWIKLNINGYNKIKTPNKELNIPEIIVLNNYDKVLKKRVVPNKKNIYKRDNGKCQYCYKSLSLTESTIDHIHPKSRSGKYSWDNCVISCIRCNLKKGNYLLHECGMKLVNEPKIPNYEKINFNFLDNTTPTSWRLFTTD